MAICAQWRHDCINGIFADVGNFYDVRVTKLGANQKGVFWVFGGLPASCEGVKKSLVEGGRAEFSKRFDGGKTCR